MTDKKDLPAFPHQKEDGSPYWGMTIRDYFAGKAMQGQLSGLWVSETSHGWTDDEIGKEAYRIADAMLAARDK